MANFTKIFLALFLVCICWISSGSSHEGHGRDGYRPHGPFHHFNGTPEATPTTAAPVVNRRNVERRHHRPGHNFTGSTKTVERRHHGGDHTTPAAVPVERRHHGGDHTTPAAVPVERRHHGGDSSSSSCS
ncbi:hypothetical protein CHUAL_002880 [Chamberlinius hualienensis]